MWGRIISTHALTEGDFFLISFTLCYFDFNSRPHGGRPSTCRHWLSGLLFQLTPSRRVTLKLSKGGRLTIISTHALTEGDPEKQGIQESSVNFNSRPHGGRQILLPPEVGKNHISTHALTEGDRVPQKNLIIAIQYFNSRPHGGRRPYHWFKTNWIDISTHALTEGDQSQPEPAVPVDAFQLTPSRRATFGAKRWQILPKNFNSRPHGGRPSTTRTAQTRCTFQLTPSRRATRGNHLATRWQPFQLTPSRRATPSRQKTDSDWYFNSRPHGGRQRLQLPGQAERHFNSRPHGGRHRIRCEFLIRTHFNSRPHGGRLLTDDSYQETLKFQLTPSRRATMVHGRATSHCVISTHALTEGDGERMPRTIWTKSFQLTPSRRATAAVFTQNCFPQYFNSRPHGGRPWREAAFARFLHFNSRPHGGRPLEEYDTGIEDAFQLTPSRRATGNPELVEYMGEYFNSRPHGGRRQS